ncbi:MAG: LptF/LptG family permease [Pseudomonadota bacterium]
MNASGVIATLIPTRADQRIFLDHLVGVAGVLMLLTVVAYTIDMASTFAQIRAEARARDQTLVSLLGPYLGQRGIDILARMLPTATFFGVFVVEIRRRVRLESVILSASGASPWRRALPLLWLAVLLGALFWALEAKWRPPAVWAQVESGLGGYAERFPIGWNRDQWIVAGDMALRADVLRDQVPWMRDVLIFNGLREPDLRAILGAAEARPAGGYHWALTGVTAFDPVTGAPSPVADRTLTLDLTPSQLRYRGFVELLLPSDALRDLQRMDTRPENAGWADVELLRRATAWLYPGLIALIAAAMVPLGFEGRQALTGRLVVFGAAGYIYVTAVKVVGRLGALDVLNPGLAVLSPLALSALIIVWLTRRAR